MSSNFSSLDLVERRIFLIGLLTQSWAMIETYIDIACEPALHQLGGRTKFRELPRSLGKKFQLLRFVFSSSPQFERIREPALAIIESADEAATYRNLCVHAVSLQDCGQSGDALVLLFKRLPESLVSQYKVITLKDLHNSLLESAALLQAVPALVAYILQAVDQQEPAELFHSLQTRSTPRPDATRREKRILAALTELNRTHLGREGQNP